MMLRLCLLTLTFIGSTALAHARVLDIQTITTPSGLNVWLVQDTTVPVVAVNFAFASGTATDPYDKQGASQLLSNMLDEGAGDLDSVAFQSALRDNVIDLSFASSRDAFYGQFRTLKRNLPLATGLMSRALTAPRFDAEPFDRMKAANATRIRSSLSNPRWISARILNETMFMGHPYANNSGGTLESLETLSPVDLRLARARHFARDRLVIGMAGDITQAQAASLADTLFSRLPQKAAIPNLSDAPFPQNPVHTHYDLQIPQTNLSMAWPAMNMDDPDYYAASVLTYVLGGGGFASRLMQTLREERGLTYGAYAAIQRFDHAARLVLDASMLPENLAPALAEINTITTDLMTTPIDADTLQYAKDYLTGSLPLGFTSTSSIAGALVGLQLDARPIDAFDQYKTAIRALTPTDIQRAARRIFSTKPVIVTVGAKPDNVTVQTLTHIPNAQTTDQ